LDGLGKLTAYFVEDADQQSRRNLVCMRAKWFSTRAPVITDIPLEQLFPAGAMVAIDGIAVCDSDAKGLRRKTIELAELSKAPFEMPHPAAIKCEHTAFIGARSALPLSDGVGQVDVAKYQTRVGMEEIEELLRAAGFATNNVVQVNAYCVGRDGEMRHLMRDCPIRTSYFSFLGPACKGAYVSRLPIPGQAISIDTSQAETHNARNGR